MRLWGRASEIEALDRRLDLAAMGVRQVAFLEGEAGIGKSRLLAEARASAEDRGFRVFQGRCEELERHRPFGALADALGCERRSPDPPRALIGRLITGDVGEATDVAGGPALQFRAVEGFVELLEGVASGGPVMLALEDLHWADPSTLLTVRALARCLARAPVLLMATFRPSPHRRELERLVQTCADEGALRLRLGPLEEDAVTALIAEAAGATPGPRLRRQLGGAGGNPLFVLELVKALDEQGALERVDGRVEVGEVGLPPSLRLTILRRLSVLPEATHELLRLASILGSTLSLTDLSAVSHRSAVDLLPALGEALRAGLLGEAEAQLAFRHDLVREAIYGDLPLSVRQGLHREAGRALAAAGAPPGRVATHLALGATPGDAEAVEWLRRAARQAAPRAPGVAADLLGRAIELIDPADPARDRLLVEQVDALGWAGRMRDSEALARDILSRRHNPAVEGALRLALGRALMTRGRIQDALAVSAAATGIAALTDRERVQLRAIAAWAQAGCGDLDGAEAAATAVRLEADRLGDDAAWCIAVTALTMVDVYRGYLSEAINLAPNVVARADRSSNPDAQRMTFHHTLAIGLVEADRMHEAAEVVQQGRRACEALGSMWSLARLYHVSTMRRFLVGEWDDAIAEVETVLAMEQVAGTAALSLAHSKLALIAVHRGELEAAQQHLVAAEHAVAESGPHPRTNWIAWARGLLHEARGSPDQALGSLEEAWAESTAMGVASEYPRLGPDLVRLALRMEKRGRAMAVTEAVEAVADRMGTASARGAALRCRGSLEADPEILLRAVTAFRKAPRPLERALACEDAAAALGRAGRLREARPLFDEALLVYEDLGARYDLDRAAAAMRSLGLRKGKRGARTRPLAGWEALTDTELRVANLAAEGMTNSQIATRLFISRHTVATHLAHIFGKLGIASRVELAAEAARRTG